MLSCECDLSKYLNPKTSILLKVIKTGYTKYKINNIKKSFNKIVDNQDLLNKIKNLDKK